MKILLLLAIFKVCIGHDVLLTSKMCNGIDRKEEQFTINLGDNSLSDDGQWICNSGDVTCEEEFAYLKLEDLWVNKTEKFAQFKAPKQGPKDSYIFELSYVVGGETTSKKIVRSEHHMDEIPIHRLATKVVRQLMSDSYEYLYLKHNFLSFDNYLPNVANFFKEKQEFVQGIRDEVITYVLQKYATTSMKPEAHMDYSCSLFSKNGLKHHVVVDKLGKKNIKESLDYAFTNEAKLLSELTNIVEIADGFGDSELAEYIGHDLVFKIQESMKTLQDHANTVVGMTKNHQGLGEYLFDKHQF